jgi:hypothetical protein
MIGAEIDRAFADRRAMIFWHGFRCGAMEVLVVRRTLLVLNLNFFKKVFDFFE